jgi:hypothetical protein
VSATLRHADDAGAGAGASVGASASAYFPPASRAAVRAAALNALVAAPADARRLLADCLRLVSTTVASKATNAAADAAASFGADLVDEVIAASVNDASAVATPGFLLAVHAAARPFQYFRDPTVTREAGLYKLNSSVDP